MNYEKEFKELLPVLEKVCKYCEDMAIYDKLGKYGDFYYKLKNIVER